MKKQTLKLIYLFLAILLTSTSCSTIINGTKQNIAIASNPSSAQITIDNINRGVTPMTISLARNKSHAVKIALDGFYPYELVLNRKVNGWIAGNIVFGGLIGLAIDAISGGMYLLSPGQFSAELRANDGNTANVNKNKDGINVFVTLHPNPEWQKVGQLQAMK